jgi:hypothetical protein
MRLLNRIAAYSTALRPAGKKGLGDRENRPDRAASGAAAGSGKDLGIITRKGLDIGDNSLSCTTFMHSGPEQGNEA